MDINWQKQGVEALSYLKGLGNKVKQIALQLTEIEVKVEDATNNEPWGPHGKDMAGEPGFLDADEVESPKQLSHCKPLSVRYICRLAMG